MKPGLGRMAVVIPHYNDAARLRRCLEALMPQVTPQEAVIVADNGSDQSLAFIGETWPEVRLVPQPEKGAGPARNAGAAAAEAEWLAFLDADCVPAADWVASARQVAAAGRVAGGEVTLFDETPGPRSGAEAFETVFAFKNERYLREEGFLASCQLVMAAADFARVGGFGNGVAEDVDWCRRAAKAGLTLAYEPGLKVAHPTRSDWAALKRKWQRLVRESYLLAQANGGAGPVWLVKALAMPVSVIAHAPRVFSCAALSGAEKRRAFGTLARLRLARMMWMLRLMSGGKV